MKRLRTIALVALTLAGGWSLETSNSRADVQDAAMSGPPASAGKQMNLGWRSKIGYRGGRLVFVLKDAAGQRVRGATVTASVARRLGACLCRTVVFFEKKPGIYVAPSALPASGTWDVRITAERSGETYEAESTITI